MRRCRRDEPGGSGLDAQGARRRHRPGACSRTRRGSRRGSCCFCRHYYGPIDRRRCGNNWLSVSFRSSARTCGNAEGSTLRLTLGCLLAGELGLQLRRVGSGGRLTFCDGEARLSEWLDANAVVTWETCPEPWLLEELLIRCVNLPLNLAQNGLHSFRPV